VVLNLQSNALKFTRSGGSVQIKVYFIVNELNNNLLARRLTNHSRADSFLLDSDSEGDTQLKSDYEMKRKKAYEREQHDKIVVTVQDTGTGISKDD
jgi:signal transduction histidine kinase